jgi:DNA-binding GntR family transcriptional regulator
LRLITARVLVGTLGAVLLFGAALASFAPRRADDPGSRAWTAPLHRMDEALAAGDIRLAERAWHDAYGQALGSRRWEGMVEAGDAAPRIRAVAKAQRLAAPQRIIGGSRP